MSTKRKSVRHFRAMAIFVVLTMCLTLAGAQMSAAAPARDESTIGKISNDVLQATANGQSTSFIIFLQDQADVSAAYNIEDQDARGLYVYNTLKEQAARTQAPIINQLQAKGVSYSSFWAANIIVAEGDRSLVEAIAARPDVKVIETNTVIDGIQGEEGPESTDEGNAVEAVESGVTQTNAPSLWTLGYNGQGIVVGNQDTGMRWTQAALRTHYRGWGGSVAASDHNYNWWDAIHVRIAGDGGTSSPATNPCGRNITAPCDDQGHGTHTTGTTVGNDAGAGIGTGTNQVGVAPGAKWIGCRNMDSGNGRASTYTECFQFFIAPTDLTGQNADPAKRPHVMNNSWGCPLSGELCARTVLQTITQNAQAAGIFVVASAGNDGSACSTVQDPPGIYDAAFSIGSFSSSNALSSFSSRGPVTSDGSGRMKPDLSARGASVRSSYYSSDTSYATMSGTSMASPHVVGSVALLWSAKPTLVRDIPRTKWLLTRSANPSVTVPNNSSGCGGIGSVPNNHFGWGRVDVLAAYNLEPSLNQAITFNALSNKTFGDADFNVSATASSGLAVSFNASGNCTVSSNTVHITGAGSCTVTASQAGLDVYSITAGAPVPYYPATDVSQTFSIAQAPLSVSPSPFTTSREYGEPNPAFGPLITGFVLGENASALTTVPTCVSIATATSTVPGPYPITCSGGAATNYSFSYTDGSLTITPAVLSVSPSPFTPGRQYSDPNPAFSPAIIGFKNGENASALTTVPTCATTATATSAPNLYPITCSGGAATNYSFSYTAGTLTVTREDAVADYTGDMLAFTPSGGSNATVLLQATVRDSSLIPAFADSAPGDIRNANVTFKEGATTLCGPLVAALINGDTTTGMASCTTSLGLGAHQIDVYVNNYYIGTTSGIVEVAQPNGSFITGGGYRTIGTSGGTYKADTGSRTNLGFNVTYKNLKSLQGHINIVFRKDGKTYQIKSTAIDSLGIALKTSGGSACSGPPSSTCFGVADFRSKANLTDVTNPLAPVSLGGNLALQVTMTDKGEPGSSDTIGITLWDGSKLVFSSEWTGAKTLEQLLGGGNLVAH